MFSVGARCANLRRGVAAIARFSSTCNLSSNKRLATVLKEGEEVPLLDFDFRGVLGAPKDKPVLYSTRDLFAGQRTLVFLDRLFTAGELRPYFPSYEKLYTWIKGEGIDDIYCASYNCGSFMRHSFIENGCIPDSSEGSLGFKRVKPLPNADCLFHDPHEVDLTKSWKDAPPFQHYAAIIDDMKVEKVFAETESSRLLNLDLDTPNFQPRSVSAVDMLMYLEEQSRVLSMLKVSPSSASYHGESDSFDEPIFRRKEKRSGSLAESISTAFQTTLASSLVSLSSVSDV